MKGNLSRLNTRLGRQADRESVMFAYQYIIDKMLCTSQKARSKHHNSNGHGMINRLYILLISNNIRNITKFSTGIKMALNNIVKCVLQLY